MSSTFPASQASSQPSRPPASATPPGGARVLVVDDEPALRRSIARLLMARGVHVDTAEDGAAAIDLLRTRSVDVMLLDLSMPAMSGMDVLAHVRQKHPDVQVLVMAAFGEDEAAVRAVRAGAYDWVVKPFTSPDAVHLALEQA